MSLVHAFVILPLAIITVIGIVWVIVEASIGRNLSFKSRRGAPKLSKIQSLIGRTHAADYDFGYLKLLKGTRSVMFMCGQFTFWKDGHWVDRDIWPLEFDRLLKEALVGWEAWIESERRRVAIEKVMVALEDEPDYAIPDYPDLPIGPLSIRKGKRLADDCVLPDGYSSWGDYAARSVAVIPGKGLTDVQQAAIDYMFTDKVEAEYTKKQNATYEIVTCANSGSVGIEHPSAWSSENVSQALRAATKDHCSNTNLRFMCNSCNAVFNTPQSLEVGPDEGLDPKTWSGYCKACRPGVGP